MNWQLSVHLNATTNTLFVILIKLSFQKLQNNNVIKCNNILIIIAIVIDGQQALK